MFVSDAGDVNLISSIGFLTIVVSERRRVRRYDRLVNLAERVSLRRAVGILERAPRADWRVGLEPGRKGCSWDRQLGRTIAL